MELNESPVLLLFTTRIDALRKDLPILLYESGEIVSVLATVVFQGGYYTGMQEAADVCKPVDPLVCLCLAPRHPVSQNAKLSAMIAGTACAAAHRPSR